MTGRDFHQVGQAAGAFFDPELAARLKRASGRNGMQWGHGAFDGFEGLVAVRLQCGHGLEQAASVGMRRGLKDIALRP
jgi:hypothetical protein